VIAAATGVKILMATKDAVLPKMIVRQVHRDIHEDARDMARRGGSSDEQSGFERMRFRELFRGTR
jgi:hypothetical protein